MSRPAASPIAKIASALTGCLLLLGAGTHLTTGSATASRGLEVSGQPALRITALRPGSAVSTTVTVRNHGPQTRWFWLSQASLSERLGEGGGRLSDALALTVLDVTDVSSPASVYRGPITGLGARPLGFLAPGAERTYSFTADLPVGGLVGHADPYRHATADLTYGWHAIAGTAAAPPAPTTRKASPRPRSDTTGPRLRFRAPARQQLLRDATLNVRAHCSEACRLWAGATVSGPGPRWSAAVTGDGGRRRARMLRVHLEPKALATVRRALLSHRVARIRLSVRARDRFGNRRRAGYTVRLLPQA